ncbi:hypothetical protein J7E62_24460 [Variovorax paradoxus]|nr:hypothetical protein [Variovorax paradoxus]
MSVSFRSLSVLVAAALLAVGPVQAQPTGNPKGTAPPPTEGAAAKSPSGSAARSRADRDEDARKSSGASTQQAPAARGGHLRTPGAGTAGGLTGRHPGDDSSNRTTETNQAPRSRPTP